ncbi:phospholipase A and acyltransferase 2-like [Biomphalaria glabrata]|uniref:Phospholipase A and acyltransferase 2-like n=1 Tax=Biomphalaria glabrata TaxID=6526 RepID=A0A9W3BDB9_BIOGL|nr:phospholipase A and acyltransferase 2-like [Biomphalaria glabrata]
MSGHGKNYAHNKQVYNSLRLGDRVEFKRVVYSHWGIYIGQGKIIHLAAHDNAEVKANSNSTHLFSIGGKLFKKAFVRIDDFWKVVGEDKAIINNSLDKKLRALSPEDIVQQAMKKIGEVGYNVITANCEHFTNWCRYGESKSEQSENAMTGLAVTGGLLLFAGAVAYGISRSMKKEEPRK